MGRLKKLLKISSRLVIIVIPFVCLLYFDLAEAAFASKFSFTAGELYTDNLFFTKQKEHDFVTTLTPTLSLLYAPTGENIPTLNLSISPSGSIFARHSDLNNFGDNYSLNGGYTYLYSPKLTLSASDVLSRQGAYRLGPVTQGAFQLPNLPTSPPPTGGTLPGQGNQNLSNFSSAGSDIANNFHLGATYLYRPDISFTANYDNNVIHYIDAGGTDLYQTIAFRGVYNWRKDHNLHAGYSVNIYSTRNNGTSVINNFDFGDDYFSNIQIQLTPTLTLSASTGLSFNTGSNGPSVANNSTLSIIKIWERGQLGATVHHGLTPSFGVGSISETTSFSAAGNMQLTEKLRAIAGLDFPLYNTDQGTFKTFQASAGLQYQFTPWLASTLFYNYRMSDASSAAARNSDGILQAGKVRANSVYLTLTTSFDIWPNPGLSRGFTSPALTPIIRTPFPTTAPTAPSTSPTPSTPTSPSKP
jgi:hypothetical protein